VTDVDVGRTFEYLAVNVTFAAQVKIWFQNRRSKVKKLVRCSPGCGDVQVTTASDDVKADQLSTASVDDEAADDDDDEEGKHNEDCHINIIGSSPSPTSRTQHQLQQQLSHRPSSWDDVPPSFQRLPALTPVHHNYPISSSDDVRLSAVDSTTASNWNDSYSSSVNRLQMPFPGDTAVSNSHVTMARQFGYQSLIHGAVHQWYSTQTSPQTLRT